MSLVTLPFTFSVGAVIIAGQHNSNFSTIYSDYNGNIQNVNIAANAGIGYAKLALNASVKDTDLLSGVGTSAGNIVKLDSLAKLPAVDGSQLINLPVNPYIRCSNTQVSGTGGGTATSGAWRTYPLTVKDSDTANIATLSSNQLTLPAGTYEIIGTVAFDQTNTSQTRIQNITDTITHILGSTIYASTSEGTKYGPIFGTFILSGIKVLELQYIVTTTANNIGLGDTQGGLGVSGVFAQIQFKKVA